MTWWRASSGRWAVASATTVEFPRAETAEINADDVTQWADEQPAVQNLGEATARMLEQAKAVGANAVVNVRFSTSNITAGAAEVMAYGTAVVVQ